MFLASMALRRRDLADAAVAVLDVVPMDKTCAPGTRLIQAGKALGRKFRPILRGAVRVIACIEDPIVIEKIPHYLDKKTTSTQAARLPPSRAPPQAGLFD